METNEKMKKNKTLKIIIILIAVATIITLAGLAYARYVTRISGQSTADIAQWSFKVNDKTNESFTIDLADTRIKANDEVQMQDGYIGPGTSGAFDIRLDATGSEVSLKYDVNIDVDNANNTKLPKNLIFYSDSTMQNAIYHENNIINLNGFIGVNDNSKVHTKTVYWKWAYETGQTQAEINANDVLDSDWMGEDISIAINVIGKQVNESPTTGEYTVTFDANGGSLQGYGNASQASKQVTYGGTYGELPTPTREGYTFAGWNGKELLNSDTLINNKNIGFNEEGRFYAINPTQDHRGWVYDNSNIKIKLHPGTYTLSMSFLNQITSNWAAYSIIDEDNNKIVFSTIYNKNLIKDTFSLLEETNIGIEIKLAEGIANIQLEEGGTATAYEPYYITSSTKVVQNQNHTLTAIWIEN